MLEQRRNEMKVHALPEQWCTLLVRPGEEQDARDAFRRYGLRAYWPCYHFVTRWSPKPGFRRQSGYRAVIPGYLFVAGPPNQTFWDVVERNSGITNVIKTYSGEMALIRNSDIDTIREIEAGLNTPKPGKSLHSFKTGDRVRFKDASWPPGLVSSSTGDGRLVVEVELMGRVVPIQLFPHQIEKA